jgi:hypothetical protein
MKKLWLPVCPRCFCKMDRLKNVHVVSDPIADRHDPLYNSQLGVEFKCPDCLTSIYMKFDECEALQPDVFEEINHDRR